MNVIVIVIYCATATVIGLGLGLLCFWLFGLWTWVPLIASYSVAATLSALVVGMLSRD